MRAKKLSSLDYQEVFEKLLPTMHKTKERLLRIMMGMPNQTASSLWLKSQLKVKDHIVVNGAIGKLGAEVLKNLPMHPDGPEGMSSQTWTVIAEMGEPIDAGFPWRLRPEVVEALTALGFEKEDTRGEEYIAPTFWEGASMTRRVNVFERSAEARRICLAKNNCSCMICGFNFAETYGSDVVGYIHVHHLIPLAKINDRYQVDPKRDLAPVCPNCHAVIHYGKTTRSLDEVKAMIEEARQRYSSSSSANTSASTT